MRTLALTSALLIAACATAEPAEEQDGGFAFADDPRLGAQVGKACFPGGPDDRLVLGDGAVAFFRGARSVVADVGGCKGLQDADIDTTVGLETTCLSAGDVLLVGEARTPLGPGTVLSPVQQRCPVRALYEWDLSASSG